MSDCIESDLAPNSSGYCYRVVGSRKDGPRKWVGVHVLAYEEANGPVPDGMDVLHSCDNTICINPEHLFAGTHSDNMYDMVAKGRGNYPRLRKKRLALLSEAV